MESKKEISKNAVVYARTVPGSKVVDELKKQERVCKIFAKMLSMKVLKPFRDICIGTDHQRPGFQALLSFCEENSEKIGAVIIAKPECLVIDKSDYVDLVEMLEEYGIEVFSLDESCSEALV